MPDTVGIEPTKVVGSIPTVVRHSFQACPVWIYIQSNMANITSIIITALVIITINAGEMSLVDKIRTTNVFENT